MNTKQQQALLEWMEAVHYAITPSPRMAARFSDFVKALSKHAASVARPTCEETERELQESPRESAPDMQEFREDGLVTGRILRNLVAWLCLENRAELTPEDAGIYVKAIRNVMAFLRSQAKSETPTETALNSPSASKEEAVEVKRASRKSGYPVILCGDHAEFEAEHANTPPHERPDWPLPSFDARDWAQAFCKIAKKKGLDIGENWMVTWFANALMRGFDENARRSTHGVARDGSDNSVEVSPAPSASLPPASPKKEEGKL